MSQELAERLARMEGQLVHIVKAVDDAQTSRENSLSRITGLEQKISYVEGKIPQIEKNMQEHARMRGQHKAEEEAVHNKQARLAIWISLFALVTASINVIHDLWTGT